jgi:hypothetical protein
VKGAGASLLVIVGLSLAIGLFFYAYSEPLTEGETLIVVLVCTLLVLAGRRLWGRVQTLWRGAGNDR